MQHIWDFVTQSPQIAAVIIGLMGALLGYLYREYRNRIRPFFQITGIDGRMAKNTENIQLSNVVSGKFASPFYLPKLKERSQLGDIVEANKKIRQLQKLWPEIRPKIESIIAARTAEEITAGLRDAFGHKAVAIWLARLLVDDRIVVSNFNAGRVAVIPVLEDNDNENGRVWFNFPGKSRSFGNHFSNSAIREKCKQFIEVVKYLNIQALQQTFSEFKRHVECEYQAAVECSEEIKNMTNEHSRWCFQSYLANLSSMPIMVENMATVTVVDKIGVQYRENVRLLIVGLDSNDGSQEFHESSTPLVIRGGEDARFALVTAKAQSGMKLGKALRECFERGQSKCHATIKIRRTGLFKRQTFRSQSTKFAKPDETN